MPQKDRENIGEQTISLDSDCTEKIITDTFEPYFKLFDNRTYEKAGFGMEMKRMEQFIIGSTTIIKI